MSEHKSIFASTSTFSAALGLINDVDPALMTKLLSRIATGLATKGKVFTEEEQLQLRELLHVSAQDLRTVLDAATYVFEQAGYHSLKPDVLRRHLAGAGMAEAQAETFHAVWGTHGTAVLEALRARTLGGPQVLRDSKWQLQLQLGQRGITKLKEPSVLFELGLGDADPSASVKEKVTVEFSHRELSSFFDSIERIQEQLDTLGYA
eukprot:CAMPEP_0196775248 /NCGR_PEP_ID=MMETSP1104-20130614/3912_1 /TAXON_ID=33652 /ORGANISM="Cafeteria sp., Strain Caron Lab Isolate" /LENGTH=205 /DNA_ID=CAMNT_0042145415 /DNA_START=35 /DNA_END=652 /DNA_ORIENTATION=+